MSIFFLHCIGLQPPEEHAIPWHRPNEYTGSRGLAAHSHQTPNPNRTPMRRIFLVAFGLLLGSAALGQAPPSFTYQAALRNTDGSIIANQPATVVIDILQGNAEGTSVFTETHSVTTSSQGIINLTVGSIEDLSALDWSAGQHFVRVTVNGVVLGVVQLLSVPYALHANTAEAVIGEINETDPIFSSWDRTTGISITENQISDLQAYLVAESDPAFAAWDRSTGIAITEGQISDLQEYLVAESDPAFTAWDRSTGIAITESQISDLQTYLVAESDPAFTAWDRSTGIAITESQISDLHAYLEEEADPAFTTWDKSTGISITESQISDLQEYLIEETDPEFTTWDRSTGIAITESQISDLQEYLTGETDPAFTVWDKSTGISITESQISDLQEYLTEEVDPAFTAWDKSTGISITENQISDLGNYIETEVDPVFEVSPAAGIEAEEIANWDETHSWGDHAIAGYATGNHTHGNITNDGKIGTTANLLVTTGTGGTLQATAGTATGQMLYWNGLAWANVTPGNQGQILTFDDGVPTWRTPAGDVLNPSTGKIWKDRNLGAKQVATSSADANAYGDLYQWGRGTDGHQLRTSGTTTTRSSEDIAGHGLFILATSSPYDWRSPKNDNLWQGLSGVNNPCPAGYRLPTNTEWDAERLSWGSNSSAGAFASPLKLPVAGCRVYNTGSISNAGSLGYYWSSTVITNYSRALIFNIGNAYTDADGRGSGLSVRCIKD